MTAIAPPTSGEGTRLRNLIEGHRLLFTFMFREGRALLSHVASTWEGAVKTQTPAGVVTRMSMSRAFVDEYNQRYEETKLRLRALVRTRGNFAPYYLVPLFAVRILTVIAAALSGFWTTFVVSLLQFIVAPYSFYAAAAAWLGILPYYLIHYAYFAVIQTGTHLLYSQFPAAAHYLRIPITWTVIAIWLVIDQLSCLLLCVWHPVGRPVRVSPKRLLQSVTYGFLNAKTYWLILLLCLRGFQIDVLALVVYALLPSGLTNRVAWTFRRFVPKLSLHSTFSDVMFYHYHRSVHLPGPYNEGHRHHHYLPDATPFDAHMHGTGMPEEWFKLMTELSMALATGLMPWSFTYGALKQSFYNRVGHTRLEGEDPILQNFHVNHHLKHFKNFGYVHFPLDLLFGTAFGNASGLGHVSKQRVTCTRQVDADNYVLVIEPASKRD